MGRHAGILVAATLTLCGGGVRAQELSPAQEPVVLAQSLNKLTSKGVAAVLWTRRTTACTLQVVLGSADGASRAIRTELPGSKGEPKPTGIQVWLLREDGTLIPSTGRWESAQFRNQTGKKQIAGSSSGPEVLFSFPLSAGKEAAAAVLIVNGQYFIEQLQPFQDPV